MQLTIKKVEPSSFPGFSVIHAVSDDGRTETHAYIATSDRAKAKERLQSDWPSASVVWPS